jgi:hypothetical protein
LKEGRMKIFNELHIEPENWLKVNLKDFKSRVAKPYFLKILLIQQDPRIILTYEGTSAFSGEILRGPFKYGRGKILFKKIKTRLFNNKK